VLIEALECRRGESLLNERGVAKDRSIFEVCRLCLGVCGEAILQLQKMEFVLPDQNAPSLVPQILLLLGPSPR